MNMAIPEDAYKTIHQNKNLSLFPCRFTISRLECTYDVADLGGKLSRGRGCLGPSVTVFISCMLFCSYEHNQNYGALPSLHRDQLDTQTEKRMSQNTYTLTH